MSHPDVNSMDRMVLLLSNRQQHCDRMFVEIPGGSANADANANVHRTRDDDGWFYQCWFAEFQSSTKEEGSAYSLRNIHSGAYLQVGEQLADGSTGLGLGPKIEGEGEEGLNQSWYITSDTEWARIKNAGTMQVIELIEPEDGSPARVVLKDNDSTNKETQVWKYERVSRAAADVINAMKKSNHLKSDTPVEFQPTDACYLNLPPKVRDQIWSDSGLGKDPLTYRAQIFDCDDFAFAAKAAVSRWVAGNLKADGFTVLFGISFAEDGAKNRHALNWHLDWEGLHNREKIDNVKFFEPRDGNSSDDAWNFKGFSGIF